MMFLASVTTTATTENSAQEQEQEQKKSKALSSSTTTNISAAATTAVPGKSTNQTGSATSEIDWHAVVWHLTDLSNNNQQPEMSASLPLQTPPTPMQTLLPTPANAKPEHLRVGVEVEVTDPDEKTRELVECYLQAAVHYGVSSLEASGAFTPIAEKFLPHILRRLLGGRKYNLQKEDAEDIAQEAILSTWNWLNSYLSNSGGSAEAKDGEQQRQGQGQEQRQEQKKELNNFWQLITIIVRNCTANWLQHHYRARSRSKVNKQSSTEATVINPVRFVSLHHVPSSYILKSRIRDFGRELELSPSHYSKAVRSSERSKSGSGSSKDMKSDLLDQLYDASTGVEVVVEQQELLRELAAAISEMGRTKPHYRLVLMEHVSGRSHRQIADENNWTLDQVKKYLSCARKWLINYFATITVTTPAANENEKEKESTDTSGFVPRAERERKKVNKSKPDSSTTSTEEWQVAAD
jgi:DNA-directed RNA polymerase specialized sigma24 family protein